MRPLILTAIVGMVFLVGDLYAASLAKIASFRGDVKVMAKGAKAAKTVKMKNYPLNAGDKIMTGKRGIARVVYPDGTWFDVRRNSTLTIKPGELDIEIGDVTADIKKGSKMLRRFNTPSGVAAVKGTLLTVIVDADGRMDVACDIGMVVVRSIDGGLEITLPGGQQIQIKAGPGGVVEVKAVKGNVVATTANSKVTMKEGSSAKVQKSAGGAETITSTSGTVQVESTATGETVTVTPQSGPTTVTATGEVIGGEAVETDATETTTTTTIQLLLLVAEQTESELDQETDAAADDANTDSTVSNTNTGEIPGVSE